MAVVCIYGSQTIEQAHLSGDSTCLSQTMITFKLHDPLTETTRRITLPSPAPSWAILSAKISFLFSIPANNVAVSYIDFDGDEVTLSTDDELEEFYESMEFKTSARLGGVKLIVKDLNSMRAYNGEQRPRTPPTIVPGNSPCLLACICY